MSPERRLSKGTRERIRRLKPEVRRSIGPTTPALDSSAWDKTEEILRLSLPEYSGKFAPHTRVLREFFDLRSKISEGDSLEAIGPFQEKYDKELLMELKSAFVLITRIVGKKA